MATTKKTSAKRRGRREHFWFALIVFAMGAALMVLGFYAPPLGEIHPSVLVGFGEALTFAGACLGLDYHYAYKALQQIKKQTR